MNISYFSYLWDIHGVSAGSAIKAREFIAAFNKANHTAYLNWLTKQPESIDETAVKRRVRSCIKRVFERFVHEPKRFFTNIKMFSKISKLIKEQKTEIIFERLELYYFAALLIAKIKKIPFVLEVDNPSVYEHKTQAHKNYMNIPFLPDFIELQNVKHADAVILISEELKKYYVNKGIPEDKLFVIPNAADPDRFYPKSKNVDFEKKFNLKGKLCVGWIGSLFGWSGIENLVDMVNHILNIRENVAFMFVGGGQNQIYFENAFKDHPHYNRVHLPGRVPFEEVNEYMTCMDIVIAPYPKLEFWYPSSMKLFEYMAAGKAVVASGIGQINEIIEEGGNGVLFDPDVKGQLTQKVLTLIDNPSLIEKLGENARETILKHYTWEIQAKKMLDIFAGVQKNGKA